MFFMIDKKDRSYNLEVEQGNINLAQSLEGEGIEKSLIR